MAMFKKLTIFPVLMAVVVVAFMSRLYVFVEDAQSVRLEFPQIAGAQNPAEDELPIEKDIMTEEDKAAQEDSEEGEDGETAEGEEQPAEGDETPEVVNTNPPLPENWMGPSEADLNYSAVRRELFEDLSNRRQVLDKREKELEMREALLKAAEQEIEQKYTELANIRVEIETHLEAIKKETDTRIQSLVKIYSGMKAKDAAKIFNTLDEAVLLDVLSQMSERKSAPILAAMNPDRARAVTLKLAERSQLGAIENNTQ